MVLRGARVLNAKSFLSGDQMLSGARKLAGLEVE